MERSRKLKAAFDRYKGVDHKLEHQKKLQKQAKKRKQANISKTEEDLEDGAAVENKEEALDGNDVEDGDEEESWDTAEEDNSGVELDISRIDESSSSEEYDEDENDDQGGVLIHGSKDISKEQAEDEEDEEDIPLSDIASLASDERGDIIPHQRLTINNHAALLASLSRIALPLKNLPFSIHQSITSSEPTIIEDVNDDLSRELALYAQSLAAVKEARKQLKSEGVSFARPTDYFAEMVKSDEHMGRVKQRLVDDAAGKRAAQDARRQRDLKKFGKAVQVAKLQERDKAKRETLDKISSLKRKRSGAIPTAETEPDMFDISLENNSKSPSRSNPKSSGPAPNAKRQKKNEKYGFGGKKRHAKSNNTASSADMRDFSVRRMKSGENGAKKRLGKARRSKARE